MEDKLEREWVPHFFVLSDAKMFYTEVHPEENEAEEADEEDSENTQQAVRDVLISRREMSDCSFIVCRFLGCSRVRTTFRRRVVSWSISRWSK